MNFTVPAGSAFAFTDERGAQLDTPQQVQLTRTITTADTIPGQLR